MMRTQMEQQQQQQQQMLQMIQRLATNQIPAPPAAATQAPETPVLQQPKLQQPTPSPRRSPRLAVKKSPRRSPRLAVKESPRLKRSRSMSNSPGRKKIKTLKRSLSYDQAFRSGVRVQKPQKLRLLRKTLSLRLTPVEARMMNGEFHDKITNKFKQDNFFDAVSPIVYSITGPPEELSDEDLPHQCLVMAKDILKKKNSTSTGRRRKTVSRSHSASRPSHRRDAVISRSRPSHRRDAVSRSRPSRPSPRPSRRPSPSHRGRKHCLCQ